nr:Chain C, Decapeptide: THR-SER-THR-PHE-GLU-ASP-VAL-LYS-ILE-LEU-ALA-PHE [synthetic construct]
TSTFEDVKILAF